MRGPELQTKVSYCEKCVKSLEEVLSVTPLGKFPKPDELTMHERKLMRLPPKKRKSLPVTLILDFDGTGETDETRKFLDSLSDWENLRVFIFTGRLQGRINKFPFLNRKEIKKDFPNAELITSFVSKCSSEIPPEIATASKNSEYTLYIGSNWTDQGCFDALCREVGIPDVLTISYCQVSGSML